MPETRECPMCGSTMKLKEIKSATRIPTYGETRPRTTHEWVCPDCDYFEDDDDD